MSAYNGGRPVGPRLLVINNKPAFYRTQPFAALVDHWFERTGGSAVVAYQVRRDPFGRSEWFYTPDDELPYEYYFARSRTVSGQPWRRNTPIGSIKIFRQFRPSHVFTAGWDTPLSLAAGIYAKATSAQLGIWVESNPSTSTQQGVMANRYRRGFLRSASFAVVPTQQSEDYVRHLHGGDLPCRRLLNPVSLTRLDSPKARPRLIFVGDLSARKGFDRFEDLVTRGAPHGWDGVAWGRDTESLASRVSSNCVVHEAVPQSELIPHLRSSDILVIPSRVDPAPLTYSEGLALGLRMIVSDTIAYREHARATPGVRVSSGDAGDLLAAANDLREEMRPPSTASVEVSPEHWALSVLDGLVPGNRS